MALKLQIWWMFDLLIQPFACQGLQLVSR